MAPSATCPRFIFWISAGLRIFKFIEKTLVTVCVRVGDSVSHAQWDQVLCCTHNDAGLIAHELLGGKLGILEYEQISWEMCAQQIGAFGIQLVLKAFFFSQLAAWTR